MTKTQIPSRIAMPCPFGGFGNTNITEISSTSGNYVNFPDGFPSVYGAPSSNNGKFVTRKEMNAIGNLASKDLFYHKCGGLNTFDPQFCVAIGGYPSGAVLKYIVNNNIFDVISLRDNNKVDFTGAEPTPSQSAAGLVSGGVDNINWAYANVNKGTIDMPVVFEGSADAGPESNVYLGAFTAPRSGFLTVLSSNIIQESGSGVTQFAYQTTSGGGAITVSGQNGIGIVVKNITSSEQFVIGANSGYGGWSCTTSSVAGSPTQHKWEMKVTSAAVGNPIVRSGNTYTVNLYSNKGYSASSYQGPNTLMTYSFPYATYSSSGILKLGIIE